MSTIEEQLKALREETLASLKQITAENKKEMQDLRVSVLGKKDFSKRTFFTKDRDAQFLQLFFIFSRNLLQAS